MSNQEWEGGYACIRVTDDLLQVASVTIEHPKAGEIRWGKMEVKELFDTFQSFLLLPEGYSVAGVFYSPLFRLWEVVVQSKDILLPPPNEQIPTLYPAFELAADGKVRMLDIGLPERWKYYAGEKGK